MPLQQAKTFLDYFKAATPFIIMSMGIFISIVTGFLGMLSGQVATLGEDVKGLDKQVTTIEATSYTVEDAKTDIANQRMINESIKQKINEMNAEYTAQEVVLSNIQATINRLEKITNDNAEANTVIKEAVVEIKTRLITNDNR